MSEEKKVDPRRITLGSTEFPVRFSYAFVCEPKETDRVDEKTKKPVMMYSSQILIPKTDPNVQAIVEKAVRAAADEKIPNKPIPPNWKTPLRDGDLESDEKGEHVKGHWFLNCSSRRRPQIVGARKATKEDVEAWNNTDAADDKDSFCKPVLDKLIRLGKDDFKSGDYGKVTLNFYCFENESKGIAVGLGNIQKLKDGEALGGGHSADDDFDEELEESFQD